MEALQRDITRLYVWCTNRGLSINESKSKVMWFGSKKKVGKLPALKIFIGAVSLPHVNHYNYLGVILDSSLNLEKHVNAILSKASHKLHMFGLIRHLIDFNTGCLIYRQTIAPIFEYCSFVLGGASLMLLSKLQRTQNRGLRICVFDYTRRIGTLDLHKLCKTGLLESRRKEQLLVLGYKHAAKLNKSTPELGSCNIHTYDHKSNDQRPGPRTRSTNSRNIQIPFVRTSFGKKAPLIQLGMEWNNLHPNLQKADSKKTFKKWIRTEFPLY
jgi:hypothetical protein